MLFCIWFGMQDKLCEGGRRYSINTKNLRTQMHLFTDQVKVFLLLSAHQWMREWILYLPQLPRFPALCKLQVFLLPALIPEVSFSSPPGPMHSMSSQCVNSIFRCFETPHNEIKCVLSIKESNFDGKEWVKIFTFAYGQGLRGLTLDPPLPLPLRSAWL